MKKLLLMLIVATTFSCSKEDKNSSVAIDMTSKTYSADAKYGTSTVFLQLKFEANGKVKLSAFPSSDFVILNYEVADKMASDTNLKIYGELDKTLLANGFDKGLKINWSTTISRLNYNTSIVGFTVDNYRFTSL